MPVPAFSRLGCRFRVACLFALLASAAGTLAQEPAGRFNHSAVWTGTEMMVWGGRNASGALNTGGRYNPTTRVWTPINTNGAPSPREYHLAQWTGTEMIVWGGAYDPFTLYNNGARYNPATDRWTAMTNVGTPPARAYHSGVWTGTQLLTWGGGSNSSGSAEVYYNTGGRYSPTSNTWAATSTTGVPTGRSDQIAVWTGDRMIIWGGLAKDIGAPEPLKTNTGGLYNPSNNTWASTSTSGAPSGRASHTGVWTGSRMIVWGGVGLVTSRDIYNTGGRYDPAANSWLATSTNANVPNLRQNHTAVWTGSEMIIWGGQGSIGNYRDSGGRYNPTTDTWASMATGPAGRAYHTAVWTGSEMIVWGGYGFSGTLQGLARYRPAENTWNAAPLCSLTAPAGGTSFGTGTNVNLTATATDTDGIISQVQFFDGGSLIGTDTTEPYAQTWSGGTPGIHSLTVVATDNNNLKTTSAPVSVTLIGPPAVSLTSPTDGATIPGSIPIALAATATPAAGAAISEVQFYDGAVWLSTDTTAPYEFNWFGASGGAHTLTAHALDNYGTLSNSAPVTITVNSPPSTSITSPSSGAVVPESSPVTITAAASDTDGLVTQVAFFDGTTLLAVTNSAPYQFNWASVPPGLRTLTTRATDNLGVIATSAPVNLTANMLPTVASANPLNGSQAAANEPIPLNASASDTDGSVAQVQFRMNGNLLGTDTTAPYGLNWTNAPLGFHTLTLIATDNLGMSRTSAPVSFESVLRPQLTSQWASNRIWVNVTGGETGRTYVVQVSSNMVDWLPFKTNLATDGTFNFNDAAGSFQNQIRFYRADP